MELNVLVVGKSFEESEKILTLLNKEQIPHVFQEVGEHFDAPLPACYVGQFQTYGMEESLERIIDYYETTLKFSLGKCYIISSPQQSSSP